MGGRSYIKYNLNNKRFGRLLVLRKEKIFNRTAWLCRCDCGQEKIIVQQSLLEGRAKSCGCLKHPTGNDNKLWNGFGEISGAIFSTLIKNARDRKISFKLTIKYLWDLFIQQNRKCKLSGIDIHFNTSQRSKNKTASLDRIDSSRGYVRGNVQWVHKTVNFMKQAFVQEDFLFFIKSIYENCCLDKRRNPNAVYRTKKKNRSRRGFGSNIS